MGQACYGKAGQPKKEDGANGKNDAPGIRPIGDPPVYDSTGKAYVEAKDGYKRRRVDLRLRVLQPCRALPQMGGIGDIGIDEYSSPVPEPGSSDEFVALCKIALQKAKDVDNINKWDLVKPNKKLADCVTEVCEQGDLVVVRLSCTLDVPLDEVVAVLRRGEGGPKESATELLDTPSETITLMWVEVRLPIVKNREFVCAQWIPESDDTSEMIIRCSLPEEQGQELRPETKKHVRGTIDTQCYFLSPNPANPNQCICKWISGVDPGGSLPNVKKMTGTKGGETIAALQKFVQAEVSAKNQS